MVFTYYFFLIPSVLVQMTVVVLQIKYTVKLLLLLLCIARIIKLPFRFCHKWRNNNCFALYLSFPFLILKTKYNRTASGKRIEHQKTMAFSSFREISASNGPYFHKHWNKMIKKRRKAKILMPFLILVPCARGKIWFIGIANKCCFFPREQSFFQSHYKHFSML